MDSDVYGKLETKFALAIKGLPKEFELTAVFLQELLDNQKQKLAEFIFPNVQVS
jgi:hypothetical protein